MATKRATSFQTTTTGSLGRGVSSNSAGDMGTHVVHNSGETAFVSFLILLTVLFCLILPFELYLYIIVKDAVEMCYKAR